MGLYSGGRITGGILTSETWREGLIFWGGGEGACYWNFMVHLSADMFGSFKPCKLGYMNKRLIRTPKHT